MGHDALVLPVVIADTKVPFRNRLHVDRPAVFESKVQTHEQGREVVFGALDDKGIPAAAQLPEAAFDQRTSPQIGHKLPHTAAVDACGRLNTIWIPMVP